MTGEGLKAMAKNDSYSLVAQYKFVFTCTISWAWHLQAVVV